MALNYPSQGEYYAAAYQISAMPYVTSSTITTGQVKEIRFSHISRFITLKNTAGSSTSIAVGFTQNGLTTAASNYFVLAGGESFSGEIRASSLWVSSSSGTPTFSLVAGLTMIPTGTMLHLTASNGYSGVG